MPPKFRVVKKAINDFHLRDRLNVSGNSTILREFEQSVRDDPDEPAVSEEQALEDLERSRRRREARRSGDETLFMLEEHERKLQEIRKHGAYRDKLAKGLVKPVWSKYQEEEDDEEEEGGEQSDKECPRRTQSSSTFTEALPSTSQKNDDAVFAAPALPKLQNMMTSTPKKQNTTMRSLRAWDVSAVAQNNASIISNMAGGEEQFLNAENTMRAPTRSSSPQSSGTNNNTYVVDNGGNDGTYVVENGGKDGTYVVENGGNGGTYVVKNGGNDGTYVVENGGNDGTYVVDNRTYTPEPESAPAPQRNGTYTVVGESSTVISGTVNVFPTRESSAPSAKQELAKCSGTVVVDVPASVEPRVETITKLDSTIVEKPQRQTKRVTKRINSNATSLMESLLEPLQSPGVRFFTKPVVKKVNCSTTPVRSTPGKTSIRNKRVSDVENISSVGDASTRYIEEASRMSNTLNNSQPMFARDSMMEQSEANVVEQTPVDENHPPQPTARAQTRTTATSMTPTCGEVERARHYMTPTKAWVIKTSGNITNKTVVTPIRHASPTPPKVTVPADVDDISHATRRMTFSEVGEHDEEDYAGLPPNDDDGSRRTLLAAQDADSIFTVNTPGHPAGHAPNWTMDDNEQFDDNMSNGDGDDDQPRASRRRGLDSDLVAYLEPRKIIKPGTPKAGLRRSKRTRVEPVRYWLNEQVVYNPSPRGMTRTLVSVTEVKSKRPDLLRMALREERNMTEQLRRNARYDD